MLSLIGLAWAPLLLALPLFALGALSVGAIAVAGARRSKVAFTGDSLPRRAALRSITALLHAMHPLARLAGRLRGGLSPWLRSGKPVRVLPRPRQILLWSERWFSVDPAFERNVRGEHALRVASRGTATAEERCEAKR